jgi:hypothetical protein
MTADAASTNSLSFLDAVRHQGPVQGHTHVLYKYPARFSPLFARAAIETFTAPGDIVLDPFVGGGTTMVEARIAGRDAFGSDISSLAVFLSRTKAVPLSDADLRLLSDWFAAVPNRLNIHKPVSNLRTGHFKGYDRNMPWRLRKMCEQYLELVNGLPSRRLQRFARCVLLRCGQWAMDCRKVIPTVAEFREMLVSTLSKATDAMRQYRQALRQSETAYRRSTNFRCIQASAASLREESFGRSLHAKPKLVLTSPPYPGVHVLYHRWNVRGRRESPAPFWLADCLDGHGSVHYTLGDRRQDQLKDYYAGIRNAFSSVRELLADDGLVVQLVAFSSPEWQLDAFLEAMVNAGYTEVLPSQVGLDWAGRLWRSVPGRRWYSVIRGDIPSSNELVLLHRKR